MKWQIYPPEVVLVVKNCNFTFGLIELILTDEVDDLPPSLQWCHLMVMNGDVTFLLLELILAYEVTDLPPPITI